MSRGGFARMVSTRNIIVIVGASCCLSIAFLRMSGFLYQETDLVETSGVRLLSTIIVSAFAIALAKFFPTAPTLKVMAVITSCSMLLWLSSIVYIVNFGLIRNMWESLILFNQGAFTISLLIQWNLHFVINRNEDIPFVITCTIVLTLLLSLLLMNFTSLFFVFIFLFSVISGVLCLWSNFHFALNPKNRLSIEVEDKQRMDIEVVKTRKISVLFFGSRVCWGLALGVVFGLAYCLSEPSGFKNGLHVEVMIVILAALFMLCLAMSGSIAVHHLILLPPIVVLILFLSTSVLSIRMLCTSAWLVWYVQSYIQLPTYRSLLAMGILRFAFYEKALTLLVFSITSLTISSVVDHFIELQLHETNELLAIILVIILLGLFMFSIGRHIMLYLPNQNTSHPKETSWLKQFASLYGLTEREKEVLTLLAEGYSRKYIEKILYISSGTARTHMKNVYQKLNVHSQDELIELVNGSCLGDSDGE
jgi:DNA-binding CsgD family transcriptional regulator